MIKVLLDCCTWNEEQLKLIEEKYKAKYVIDTCLPDGHGGWLNFPAAIFYTETPHPEGSNYFAFFKHAYKPKTIISNGYEAIKDPIEGIMIDHTVIWSRFRHDCRGFGGVFIDGGRDYTRIGGERIWEAIPVMIHVKEGKVEVHIKDNKWSPTKKKTKNIQVQELT